MGAKHRDAFLKRRVGREQETQTAEAERLAKIQAQTAEGSGGRPELSTETDEDFKKSLIEQHQLGYGARMARSGL